MKKLFLLTSFVVLLSCDPSESVDTVISNNTASDIEVSFVSHVILSDMPNNTETINIQSNAFSRYDRLSAGGSLGQADLKASDFSDFDSIYISKNSKVVKIYKKDVTGKNIYNVDDYWEFDKDHFQYKFTINKEDLN